MPSPPDPSARPLHESHPRQFEANRYVYPVLSRRAGGISIGVNLNPDAKCSFRCIYCQVERGARGLAEAVDVDRLREELDRMVSWVTSGAIYEGPRFAQTPPSLRRLNDIALSGDGEPTLCEEFGEVVEAVADCRRRWRLDDVKLVLITNSSLLHQDRVRSALAVLDANHGEIWAKLDAGTETYFRRVSRSSVPFRRILDNLAEAARGRPLVIQSLFMRIDGQPPSPEEQEAYCERLGEILAAGGQIRQVQIHTIARKPAEPSVTALGNAEMDALGELVRHRTGLVVSTYHGS